MSRLFGLIGTPLGHSFSRGYFEEKFKQEGIDAEYRNFDIPSIDHFQDVISGHPNLSGLNVTIPYKKSVISNLDEVEAEAKKIGAVNTIKVSNGKLFGFNTDYRGFQMSLENFIPETVTSAVILGSGGSSGAVVHALKQLGISFQVVSRNPAVGQISYEEIDSRHLLWINTTPLGMFPNLESCPPVPYHELTSNHYLFDLVYNPEMTKFLTLGKEQGAHTRNGYEMLVNQAELSWEIWNQ